MCLRTARLQPRRAQAPGAAAAGLGPARRRRAVQGEDPLRAGPARGPSLRPGRRRGHRHRHAAVPPLRQHHARGREPRVDLAAGGRAPVGGGAAGAGGGGGDAAAGRRQRGAAGPHAARPRGPGHLEGRAAPEEGRRGPRDLCPLAPGRAARRPAGGLGVPCVHAGQPAGRQELRGVRHAQARRPWKRGGAGRGVWGSRQRLAAPDRARPREPAVAAHPHDRRDRAPRPAPERPVAPRAGRRGRVPPQRPRCGRRSARAPGLRVPAPDLSP
mmetsp:Transcript_95912/g.271483  ORF Transcript_95912/g.271483 Transcript_95912/m.271483 type:complete len:271 (+) Transcript_95912:876-1688(+)